MEESLKSARISYLALLAVCATVLLFGFSPNKADIYESGINELNILRSIDKSSLHDYFYEAVNTELKDFDFKAQFNKRINNYTYAKASPDIDWSPAKILPYAFEPLPLTATLAEIESYFLNTYPLYVFKPHLESWEYAMTRGIRDIHNTVSRTDARAFIIESVNLKDSSAIAKFQKIMKTPPETINQDGSDVYATLTIFWAFFYTAEPEQQPVRGRFVPLESYTFASWFNTQDSLRTLKQRMGDQDMLFPNLRPVWNQIRTSTIDEAIVMLNRKNSESKKSMTVLGFTANEDIIILVAPLTILCVFLYLLVQILHIRTIEKNYAEILSEFPWIVLFPGVLSRFLTYGSLSLLPTLANTVILIRSWDMHSNSTWVGLLFAFLSLMVGIKAIHEIMRLQRPIKRYLLDDV
jgi:hypothetical protein